MNNKIIIINGPNLNLLGEREQSQYGSTTFKELKENCLKKSNEIGITELEIQEPLLLSPSFVGEKPNLDRLHHLLKEINGHGWKPRTPMRVTLMKCLAQIE